VLPTTSSRWALIAVALVVVVGAALAIWAQSSSTTTLIQSFVQLLIATALLSYLASGALMTPAMSAVGLSIWKFTLSIAVEIAIGIALVVLLPQIRIRAKR
jgi:hypothetical protein